MNAKGGSDRLASVFAILVGIGTFHAASASSADPVGVNINPPQIILNAQGNAEDIQAVLNMALESGYTVAEYEVVLYFEDVEIAEAFAFRYCYVDTNFLAGFDRDEVLHHPEIEQFVGETVVAKVEGWYRAVNSEGDERVREFYGYDPVEIYRPDPCWGDADGDGDVDGSDVVAVADEMDGHASGTQVEFLAEEFGRDDCLVAASP